MKDAFIPLSVALLDSESVIAKMYPLYKNEKVTLIFYQGARYAPEVN